jgi:threonine synthase
MKIICSSCNSSKDWNALEWKCHCGSPLDLQYKASFPLDKIKQRPSTFWRYREALPIPAEAKLIALGENCTPLVDVEINGHKAFFKPEYLLPTGSFKDRGTAIMISYLKHQGLSRILEDSSGNAGASIAAYAARAGIAAKIYVPATTSPAKKKQIEIFGAELIAVEGSRDNTAATAQKAALGIPYASHVWNPWFVHGTKTAAYEIAEELNWQVPEQIVLPVGNGSMLLGLHLGFTDLLSAGVINSMPRLIAVQAANCAPLIDGNLDFSATAAEGIAVQVPARKRQIHKAVAQSRGQLISVTEEEIKTAHQHCLQKGFMIEPTSAVAVAGWQLLDIDSEKTVVMLTGHGLKSLA